MSRLIEHIQAVAFDLDGTLIDTAPDLTQSINAMLAMLGGATLAPEQVRAMIGNGVDLLVLRALTAANGGRPPRPALQAAGNELFRQIYARHVFDRSSVYPGVPQALNALIRAGIVCCCVTNKESTFAEPLLEASHLSKLMRFTLCADRPEDRKPSPNLLLAACARLGIAPREMLYVGDSTTDLLAARSAGCRAVSVDYGYNRELAPTQAVPDAIISDLRELLTLQFPRVVLRAAPTSASALEGKS